MTIDLHNKSWNYMRFARTQDATVDDEEDAPTRYEEQEEYRRLREAYTRAVADDFAAAADAQVQGRPVPDGTRGIAAAMVAAVRSRPPKFGEATSTRLMAAAKRDVDSRVARYQPFLRAFTARCIAGALDRIRDDA